MVFLELQWEPGLYSRVTMGMALQNSSLFSDVISPVLFEGHLRIHLEAWQGNREISRGETGDPGSLSSCHRDIGISINFEEESGIVTF